MDAKLDVRPSPISGKWYPGEARRLADSVDRYIQAAKLPEIEGEVVAVMAPHAGHMYSGPVAGYAFAAILGSTAEVIAVVSPMHYPIAAELLTSAHSAYATPLGQVEVDREGVEKLDEYLRTQAGAGLSRVANDPEHSLEIELPFLQRALDHPFRLLPVMVREHDPFMLQTLGKGLAQAVAGKPALLVASTDLSHFYPQSLAEQLDREVLRRVEAFDPQGVLDVEEQGLGFACGRGALAAVLWAARELGANQVQVLRHATSGDVTGDYGQVVGYGAAVITRKSV